MVDAAYAILDERPKAFDSICMSIAANPNLSRVMDSLMLVSRRAKLVIRRRFIGKNHRAWQNSFLNKRNERSGFGVGYD